MSTRFRRELCWSVLIGVALTISLLALVGCNIKADVTIRGEEETAAIGAPGQATSAPAVSATPPTSTQEPVAIVFLPPPIQSVVGNNRVILGAQAAIVDDNLFSLIDEGEVGLAAVQPLNQSGTMTGAAPLESVYLFTSAVNAANCAPGGTLQALLPPSASETGLRTSLVLQRPLLEVCWAPAGDGDAVRAALCPGDPTCVRKVDFLLLNSGASSRLHISQGLTSPGGDDPPAYCSWICPSGGGLCTLVGC